MRSSSADWRSEDLTWLHRLARRLACSDADADDLVQSTVLASGTTVEPARRPWLGGVLRNRWRMWSRGARRRSEREAASTLPSSPLDPEQALARAEIVDLLCTALGTLPELDRRIVILRHCEGLTSARIGDELGMPAATVRTRLSRALDRLRHELDRGGPPQWQLAVAALPSKVGFAMVSTLKLGLTGSAIVLAVAGTWLIVRSHDAAPTVADERKAASAPSLAAGAGVPPNDDDDHYRDAAREAWTRKLAAIRASRRDRLGDDEPAPSTDETKAAFSADELEKARDEVREMFANPSGAHNTALAQLGQQVAESFLECLEFATTSTGKIQLHAAVIGEPDVGTVVESVDVREDSVGDAQLLECVRESIYTFDFAPPEEALSDEFDFTLDLDERTISAGNQLGLEELPAALQKDPQLLDELPSMIAETPGLAEGLREMFAEDPSLAQKYPDVAAKLAEQDG